MNGIDHYSTVVEYGPWDYDPEWDYDKTDECPEIYFEATVEVTKDMYATGDSPTGYEVIELAAFYRHSGHPISLKCFTTQTLDWVEEQAINNLDVYE